MPNLFTSHTGEVFSLEVPAQPCERHDSICAVDYPLSVDGTMLPRICKALSLSSHDVDSCFDSHDPDTPSQTDGESGDQIKNRNPSCGSTNPLIEIIGPDGLQHINDLIPEPVPPFPVVKSPPPPRPNGKRSRPKSWVIDVTSLVTVKMVYNEYGELVEERDMLMRPKSDELSVKQLLRVIKKAYHHELRDRVSKIVTPRADGRATVLVDDGIWRDRLSSWDFKVAHSPKSLNNSIEKLETPDTHTIAVYQGPPRVLELGCSDGNWCFNFKLEQPDWYAIGKPKLSLFSMSQGSSEDILSHLSRASEQLLTPSAYRIVEGIDDTNHWSCIAREVAVKDFMSPNAQSDPDDYFGIIHTTQEAPEFTMRNLNCLLAHETPILHNLYEFIRAREIFDRVESYKTFLDDVRSMLKPVGVVEFLEIDPRPRAFSEMSKSKKKVEEHKSVPQTDWTDNIADRFKNLLDRELATTVPGWSGRVEARLNATMRPQDGVAAAHLKSWLQGSGFWDVKQIVLPIPVGGDTRSGQLLKEFILYQLELENCIPKLCDELPKVEISEMDTGAYFMNLHIVTGRKPYDPRPGDLLRDGTRQEMTASKYDAMARHHDSRASQWKRFDLQEKLTTMMKSLTSLTAPTTLTGSPPPGDADHLALLSQRVEGKSPFMAPPFVAPKPTMKMVKVKTTEIDPVPATNGRRPSKSA
ncbi:uncharacterized protein RSE6_06897 [Rhynchosporium secalis]|uniref:Uncharacterized protein n=1 Tax=Rhynchosporium secalis TaxID=38038 RepID=A0A1E1MBJ8_RHYSE|nr:uncharacterized protein RSE6_06897 [Rhynchosporium secalis]